MIEIRLPNINSPTDSGKIQQIQDYLFQTARQINLNLAAMDNAASYGQGTQTSSGVAKTSTASGSSSASASARTSSDNFYVVRDLMVKTADIVEECSTVLEQRMSSKYVATGEFGQYKELNDSSLMLTSAKAIEAFETLQSITNEEGNVKEIRNNSFFVTTGWLDDNKTIGGIQLGMTKAVQNVVDGVTVTEMVDHTLARFTTNELAFFDADGNRVTWFGIDEVNMSNATVKGRLDVNGYRLDGSNGLAFKWVGVN